MWVGLNLIFKMPLTDLWKGKSPEEIVRQNQRALRKTMREIDRERANLEKQERKVIADIKKTAKTGQMAAVKIMAKDLVRTRNHIKKFHLMRANIQGITLKLTTMKSQMAMAQSMKGVSRAMNRMNAQMKLPQIQKIMMDFERESEIMDMKEEMISDTMEDVMGEDEEEESEAVVQQVFDELGLQWVDELSKAVPSSGPLRTDTTMDFEERLEKLKSSDAD
ncbi:PREDICTED: charged multivesicular body protein 2a-like [Amphimedon queenslandica]|uniref:Charged multivesicular body protein 2a n=1 Tax=Amphimedon queenslandica TaxID=400682 RepID=A0AAN0I9Q6_AMPQE|nr:PREDICTED: charged multivesicular body protein 2a-like [Amphimedon queenslandica]|eukprot:XP_003383391.2 PREDICTED: charged multivesicular body protein 2a-like [Amphimedon queenslandica]